MQGSSQKCRAARAARISAPPPHHPAVRVRSAPQAFGHRVQCCFCQNRQISQEWFGKAISVSQLSEILLSLQEQGAETLDLVTGSHYAPWIAESLQQVKPQLHIPVVWNSSGYDSPGSR